MFVKMISHSKRLVYFFVFFICFLSVLYIFYTKIFSIDNSPKSYYNIFVRFHTKDKLEEIL